mgnify:CR=1 FL=1|jgi:hypothetical protein
MKKGETYLGREILHIEEFAPAGTFQAYYKAEQRLKDLGYTVGSMCGPEPIGFADADQYHYVSKWYNMNWDEKNLLDGVMISEGFREGGVKILFFTQPKL